MATITRVSALTDIGRRIYRALPPKRRLRGLVGFRPRRLVQFRRLIPGADRIPLVVRTPDGSRLRFGRDPIDEEIAEHVFVRHRLAYFPPFEGEGEVKVVLDLGAHHGVYMVAASTVYPSAHMVCVEPSPRELDELKANVALNRLDARVTTVPAALADRDGEVVLNMDVGESWGNSLFALPSNSDPVRVPSRTLSSMLGDLKPDVVKSNAEGAEFELVRQLVDLGLRPGLLVIEVHPEHGDVTSIGAQLRGIGYTIDEIAIGSHPMWHCRRGVL